MLYRNLKVWAAACVVTILWANGPMAEEPADDAAAIAGLWRGGWGEGGPEADGTFMQPVIVEMVIAGDRIELLGFPQVGDVSGTVRIDTKARRMRVTPGGDTDGPKQADIAYTYELEGGELTLSADGRHAISLERQAPAADLPANTSVEIIAATEIDDAGNLIVTGHEVHRATRTGTLHVLASPGKRFTERGSVLLVQESGWKQVTVDEARRLIDPPTLVAIVYWRERQPLPYQHHELWENTGPPEADEQPVWQSLSKLLRPGTLVFILSAEENAPRP